MTTWDNRMIEIADSSMRGNSLRSRASVLDFFHRSIVPSKRALSIALCWVALFVCRHVLVLPGGLVFRYSGHQARSLETPSRLIDARIVRGLPVRGLHADGTDVEYRCSLGEAVHRPKAYKLWGGLNGTRQPLGRPLTRPGVLDFAIHVSDTKLRMLIVGNSLAEQLHAGLEEAMCYPVNMTAAVNPSDRQLWSDRSSCRTIFAGNPDGQWTKEPRIVFTSSGGVLAVIKDSTYMIDTKTKWNSNNPAISSLVMALGSENATGEIRGGDVASGERLLHVLVYQFQSGHVDLRDFDEYYLEEATSAAGDLFKAASVIVPTIAWMNNVDVTRVDAWHEVNNRIRNFARRYTPVNKFAVESVQVLDIAELSRSYIEANAKILGIPPQETYTLRVKSRWESLVAQMCASLPFAEDPRGCSPGMVSLDGMHLCPETFHGRINAALVCLLDCKFNHDLIPKSLSMCSDGCNSKYMNLSPISFFLTTDPKAQEEISLTL